MDQRIFFQRLAEERKRRGYTQKQIAQALGVSDKTCSKWETGENEMDVGTLCRLAEFYGESPAIFFREESPSQEGVCAELAALSPAEAAQRSFRLHFDALIGMQEAAVRSGQFRYGRPLPGLRPPENPSEHRSEAPATTTAFDSGDLLGLVAAGPDANLSLLILPHAQSYAWLESEGERLQALFQVLAMPGAMTCLRFLLSQPNDRFFSRDFLAQIAGVSREEMGEFLLAASEQLLCAPQRLHREGREETLYRSVFRTELVGILTLARLMLPFRLERDPLRYGQMGGTGGRLPEKGGRS